MECIIGNLCCKKISLECTARKTFNSTLNPSILPTKRHGLISHESHLSLINSLTFLHTSNTGDLIIQSCFYAGNWLNGKKFGTWTTVAQETINTGSIVVTMEDYPAAKLSGMKT